MLHGWMQNLKALEPLAKILAAQRPIVLIDLPGFGESAPPDQGHGTAWYQEQVLPLLDRIGINQFDLYGHSFGGRIAVRLAANHPERVRLLILNAAHGLQMRKPLGKQVFFSSLALIRTVIKLIDRVLPGAKLYQNHFIPRFASRDYKNAGVMREVLVKTVNEDLSSLATRIEHHALLLWGTEDQETPLSMGKRYAQLITNAQLIELTGHGHMPYEDVGSHLLSKYISEFLANEA